MVRIHATMAWVKELVVLYPSGEPGAIRRSNAHMDDKTEFETDANDANDDRADFKLPSRLAYSRVRWRLLSDILAEAER